MPRVHALILGLLVAMPAQSAPAETLPAEVVQLLKHHGLSNRGLSVYVHEVGQPEPLLAVAADVPRNPASTMKLLTTLVALEELGPGWTWKTEAYASAPVRDGVLDGDLYIKGYGDPYLVIEHFWRFLRALRKGGLTEIRGDLVIDQGFFDPGSGQPADFDRRPQRAYNVQPRALLVNFQAVNFRFLPQARQQRVEVIADPQPAQFAIDNRVRLASGPCRGGARAVGMQVADRAGLVNEASFTLVFSGGYSAQCGEDELYRVVAESEAYIHGVFKTLWTEMGGRFAGKVREAAVPDGAALLHSATSPPLSEIIRVINKYSNNVMTRQLLLTLGAEKHGAPGTVEKGVAVIHEWLTTHGLHFPELVLENGSGLSRTERISARHLGAVLLAAWRSPTMPEFLASLPILSVDGTLKRRHGGELAGRAHLKGGSIDGVRAQAGLLLDEQGRRMIVVVLHNDARVDSVAGEQVQNAVLGWVNRRP